MTEDLVQWLRAQLDEDERIARAACWDDQSDVWTARPPQGRYAQYERYTVVDYLDDGVVAVTPENADADGVGQHIARHDPARVLREIDAKRKLLTRWRELQDRIDTEPDEAKRGNLALTRHGLDMFVYQLGGVYADRPGYREEWRP